MKSDYRLQDLRIHKEGFLASLKRRLNTVFLALTSKGFIFIKFEDKGERVVLDITNHKVDLKTTINALDNYKNILNEDANYSIEMDKNIEKWLHTES